MIRKYQREDLEKIMDIANRAWRPIYKELKKIYGEELFKLLRPNEETIKGEEVKAHCEAFPDWVYICEEHGKIVGFITYRIDKEKKIGEILNNAVDPECGLKGIGQQMYKAVLQRFKEEGLIYAMVKTGLDKGHERARRAYERAGFNIKYEEITYWKKL